MEISLKTVMLEKLWFVTVHSTVALCQSIRGDGSANKAVPLPLVVANFWLELMTVTFIVAVGFPPLDSQMIVAVSLLLRMIGLDINCGIEGRTKKVKMYSKLTHTRLLH